MKIFFLSLIISCSMSQAFAQTNCAEVETILDWEKVILIEYNDTLPHDLVLCGESQIDRKGRHGSLKRLSKEQKETIQKKAAEDGCCVVFVDMNGITSTIFDGECWDCKMIYFVWGRYKDE